MNCTTTRGVGVSISSRRTATSKAPLDVSSEQSNTACLMAVISSGLLSWSGNNGDHASLEFDIWQ
ncbi:hypothetical protein Ae717Ps2_6792 [Pseudonocardia sp. Ae717_Ps2]|nr:hypothetical protein Ae717Ps2_6792 [Pseudonocardia sp. Ae717_Ps2]